MRQKVSDQILDGARLFAALIKVRLLRRRVPFFIGWNITFRCSFRCKYCGAVNARREEMPTGAVLETLDGLWELGARWITFGGGEPLLRKDIDEVMAHARQLGFRVYLSTNGSLLAKNVDCLRNVDHVNLSLDGPKVINDAIRGVGAFDAAVKAMTCCKKNGVTVSLQCVLSSMNLDCIDELLAIASKEDVKIMFHPATRWLDSSTAPNPIAPPVDAYRACMKKLIQLKRKGAPVRNSVAGLKHLVRWPDDKSIWCGAGRISCELEPDGTLVSCHQFQVDQFLKGVPPRAPVAERFGAARPPQGCEQCWCGPVVELALLFSLNVRAILNAFQSLK